MNAAGGARKQLLCLHVSDDEGIITTVWTESSAFWTVHKSHIITLQTNDTAVNE